MLPRHFVIRDEIRPNNAPVLCIFSRWRMGAVPVIRRRRDQRTLFSPNPRTLEIGTVRHFAINKALVASQFLNLTRSTEMTISDLEFPSSIPSTPAKQSLYLRVWSIFFAKSLHFLGRFRVSERSPRVSELATLARVCRKSPARTAEIPVFEETIGGDGFDRHCVVGMAVAFRASSRNRRNSRFGETTGGDEFDHHWAVTIASWFRSDLRSRADGIRSLSPLA
jgi:hypothetical protein